MDIVDPDEYARLLIPRLSRIADLTVILEPPDQRRKELTERRRLLSEELAEVTTAARSLRRRWVKLTKEIERIDRDLADA